MFSIDMFKSYKFKEYDQLFVPMKDEIASLESSLDWLFYYIDKSSLEVSQNRLECEFEIKFFYKGKLISETDFFMNSNSKFWLSFTDNQLFFVKKTVKDIVTFSENLWVYIVPEKIDVHRDKFYSRVERHWFKNFKVFDTDFKFLYEIRDKGVSLEKKQNIVRSYDGGDKAIWTITKEWFFIKSKDLNILPIAFNLENGIEYYCFLPFSRNYYWETYIDFKETIFVGINDYIKLETWKNSLFGKLYNFLQEKKFLFYNIWKDSRFVYDASFGFSVVLEVKLEELEEYWEKKFLEWMKELGWNFSQREDKHFCFKIWYSKELWIFFDISQYEKVEHLGWDEYWVSTKEGYRDYWRLTKDWNIVLINDIKEEEKDDEKTSSKDVLQKKEIERFFMKKSWWEKEERVFYIKTKWSKWLKKIYRDTDLKAKEELEKEKIYFINNDIKHRTSITFSFGKESNELLERKQFIYKFSFYTMLVQDNWKFNYIF